jgi:hypothetical protein
MWMADNASERVRVGSELGVAFAGERPSLAWSAQIGFATATAYQEGGAPDEQHEQDHEARSL